ncbi:uncharacterized protein PHACADRAFT_184866 [Phanerochaete carnosa HHB-10118-sp]|uniref:BTB domain-containing protein n=1 Tax=Phanerochaete carnosa (strain HHB-10118-sp) TaxID=650164 RepID=K5WAE4_PHACS|nr:uncharacterized protein PHACADRAFT_184866 [Phanerochaete carnosa HHB-10118-sp]EKM56190.1 hypothetical protein PHACADRAFT_184866 [Phanerochaete carnosa HHB-10118-sp]
MSSSVSSSCWSQGERKSDLSAADSDINVEASLGPELIRDEHIWFKDGNIIICAGPYHTGDGPMYGFRCHASVLASRSPVFKTMLQLPNASGRQLGGTPCVDLLDQWEDIRDLLRLLYGFPIVLPGRRHPDTLKIVAGPMRLAAKYEMDGILNQLAPILERDWPSKYEDWMHAEKEFEQDYYDRHPDEILTGMTVDEYQDPAAAVQLAQQTRLLSILPAAFYDLSRIYLRTPAIRKPDGFFPRCANTRLLSRDDLERLAVGRERIAKYAAYQLGQNVWGELITGDALQLKGRCSKTDRTCLAYISSWLRTKLAGSDAMHILSSDPMISLDRMAQQLEADNHSSEYLSPTCHTCRSWFAHLMRKEAKTLWDKLPEIFELDSLTS